MYKENSAHKHILNMSILILQIGKHMFLVFVIVHLSDYQKLRFIVSKFDIPVT